MFDQYEDNELVKCPNTYDYKTGKPCGWVGEAKEMRRKYVNSEPEVWMALAGREGYEYFCPVCGWMIKTYYWRMS